MHIANIYKEMEEPEIKNKQKYYDNYKAETKGISNIDNQKIIIRTYGLRCLRRFGLIFDNFKL